LALHGALIALQSLPFFSIFDSQQLSCPPGNAPQFLPPHTPHSAAQHAIPSSELKIPPAFLHSAAANARVL
jgi:hypothetical protein